MKYTFTYACVPLDSAIASSSSETETQTESQRNLCVDISTSTSTHFVITANPSGKNIKILQVVVDLKVDFDIGDEIGTTGTKTFVINVSDAVVPESNPESESTATPSPATTTTTTTTVSIRGADAAAVTATHSDDIGKESTLHSTYRIRNLFISQFSSTALPLLFN